MVKKNRHISATDTISIVDVQRAVKELKKHEVPPSWHFDWKFPFFHRVFVFDPGEGDIIGHMIDYQIRKAIANHKKRSSSNAATRK